MEDKSYHATLCCLNRHLKSELTAVEAYDQVIDCRPGPEGRVLRTIAQDHRRAIIVIQHYVRTLGGVPSINLSIRRMFSNSVLSFCRWLPVSQQFKLLQEQEWRNLKEYQTLSAEPDVFEQWKDYVREELIPNQQDHLRFLEQLRRQAGASS